MELIGLDKDFRSVGYIPFVNLQWQRRYYEAGKWTAQIRSVDYEPSILYVYSPDRPELGIVERIQSQTNTQGRFVLLSGRFVESVFDRQLAFPHVTGKYTIASLFERMATHQWYKPDLLTIVPDPDNPTAEVTVKWERQPIGMMMYETLKTHEMSWRIAYDPNTNGLTLKVWRGLDRTQTQSENAFATFTEESSYVSDFSYVEDWSNYKNVIMVLYGSNPYRKDIYGPNANAEGRRWQMISSSEESPNEAMQQEADEELQRYPVVREAEVEVLQDPDGLLYMVDYDLGDKCDIVSHEYQKAFEARISGIDEVWKQGRHTVTLLFGEQAQTAYERLKNYVNSQSKALGLTVGLNDGRSWEV